MQVEVCLTHRFQPRVIFAPPPSLPGTFGNVWRPLSLSQLEIATGIWWVAIKDAAKLPTLQR